MKPKDLNERQTAFALALARLISDENSEREFAAMDNGTEFSILMDIATKLPRRQRRVSTHGWPRRLSPLYGS